MDLILKQRKKIAILAAFLYAASFILPWFELRASRVSTAESFFLWQLGSPFWILAGFPAIALLLLFQTKKEFAQKIGLFIQGIFPAVFALVFLSLVGITRNESLGEIGRSGIGIGLYLYLLGAIVCIIPGNRPKGLILSILLVVLSCTLTLVIFDGFTHLGIVKEGFNQRRRLVVELLNHLRITLVSTGISAVMGIPLAIWAYSKTQIRQTLFPLLNILQTIPSVALFGLMIAPLAALSRAFPVLRDLGIRGIGNAPAIIALSVYALYPIMRYSFTGLSAIDEKVIDAGRGMGMTNRQLWRLIRIPLSTPVILHGIRVALIQTLGNATLAKLIGGNGLGVFVFEGLGQASADMVLLGMLMIIGLTLISDQILSWAIWYVSPVALRKRFSTGGINE